jgi:Rrf2 family protein
MQLTTRIRYAARAMVELGFDYPNSVTSTRHLAQKLVVSEKYLETILKSARRCELVKTTRGVNGGVALARSPDSITLLDLYNAVEGSLIPVDCVDAANECQMAATCACRDTWVEIRDAIASILSQTTIQDLVDRKAEKTESVAVMYHI